MDSAIGQEWSAISIAAWAGAIVVLVGLLLLTLRVSNRRPARRCPESTGVYPECLYVVTVSDDAVTVTRPDGSSARMLFVELREVVVETNDSGPWGADVWWHLFASASAPQCSYPGGATGENAALQFMQTLTGFDNGALIDAMRCTDNKRFIVYQAPSNKRLQP